MNICIYGAASAAIDDIYIKKTEELAYDLGKAGHGLVFGGGSTGLMGAAARGMKKANAEITGVIPTFFKENEVEALFTDCTTIIWTETMRERKAHMEEKADCFIVTPGGIGTFEEAFEILTLKQLGRHTKAIVFYNIGGYYDPLLAMMDNSIDKGFIRASCRELYFVTDCAEEIMDYLGKYEFKASGGSKNPYK